MQAARALWFLVAAPLWTLLCFLLATLALCLEPRRGRLASRVSRLWGRGLLASQGIALRISGAEGLGDHLPRVIAANHASFLDPPALMAALPLSLRFVLKRELLKLPLVGWFGFLGGHFFVTRTSSRSGHRSLERAVRRARRNALSPVVFPEGTRTRTGRLGRLRTGAFALAVESGLPVLPVWIEGSYDLMPPGALWPRGQGSVAIRVGREIAVEGLTGSSGRRAVQERVLAAWAALAGQPGVGAASGSSPE